jgi:hypothetical protein
MRRILSLFVFFAAVALLFSTTTPTFAQGSPPSTAGKTAGETKKNIQVLKTLPAAQLDMVMDFVASSLGVQCNHCHVIDTTGWYMDKDDKPAKKKARQMMQMVMDLNAKNFGGRDAVSCYTCHRGSTAPASVMSLPVPMAKAHEESKETANLPSAADLLAKYESALGGADAIAKVTSMKRTGVSVDGQGKESPLEIVQAAGNKYLSKVTIREGMVRAVGMNGASGWMSSPRGVRPLPPDAIEELKHEASFFPLASLREKAAAMRVLGKDTMNGATVYRVAAPGAESTNLYCFDAESGLLVREASMTTTMIGTIPEQTDYMDYRAVNGVKVPFVVRNSSVDAHDSATERFSSIEQNVAVDESIFTMPAGKK